MLSTNRSSPLHRISCWRASSAKTECLLEPPAFGRPKCILETNRVDLRPEKSAASSDFEDERGVKLELRCWREDEPPAATVAGTGTGGLFTAGFLGVGG